MFTFSPTLSSDVLRKVLSGSAAVSACSRPLIRAAGGTRRRTRRRSGGESRRSHWERNARKGLKMWLQNELQLDDNAEGLDFRYRFSRHPAVSFTTNPFFIHTMFPLVVVVEHRM